MQIYLKSTLESYIASVLHSLRQNRSSDQTRFKRWKNRLHQKMSGMIKNLWPSLIFNQLKLYFLPMSPCLRIELVDRNHHQYQRHDIEGARALSLCFFALRRTRQQSALPYPPAKKNKLVILEAILEFHTCLTLQIFNKMYSQLKMISECIAFLLNFLVPTPLLFSILVPSYL